MGRLKQQGSILLISCYELGHQPAGITVPLGFLNRAGYSAATMDLSIEGFDREKAARARFVGVSVPMHTALRLGLRVAEAVRRINPDCHICFYGLYATLNADYLLDKAADSVTGGEFEQTLVALIQALDSGVAAEVEGVSTKDSRATAVLRRLDFAASDRSTLPPLARYARLEHKGEERLAGYVEASRGCLHHCTHCPIPPVYGGRFFAIGQEVVLEEVRNLVRAGARHITFGDPDFLNGPTHALRVTRLMHEEFPGLTFDFTAKVEHLLKHRDLLPEFAARGCFFIVSAVESLSDLVLSRLEKGHTRADVFEALGAVSEARIALRPSFVSFTPWTTLDDYTDVLDFIERHELIENVDAVQYTIRLLVPPGSLLLTRPDTRRWLGPLNQESFSYEWKHTDPLMDYLHREVSQLVEQAVGRNEDATVTFYRIRDHACALRGREVAHRAARTDSIRARLRPPRLTEAWFC